MLSTITPLSERAKGHSYRSTAGWFVLGGAAGGATLGVAMAGLAAGVRSLHLSPTVLGLCALGAAVTAAVSDAGIAGVRLPVHRRQVNERWLDQYRPWVYGAGFGWQIGAGLVTYITTAAVYLMIVLGALTAAPVAALADRHRLRSAPRARRPADPAPEDSHRAAILPPPLRRPRAGRWAGR